MHEVSKNKVEDEKVSQANRVQTRFSKRRSRVQTRLSNRRSSNKAEKRTCIQDKFNSNKEIKEKKGKQNKIEAQRKEKSADKIPILNNKERNEKASGPSKIVRSQARKRAKLEPKSNEAMHSKENSVKAGIEMQIHASQEENFEEKVYTEMENIEERLYTEMKGIKGNGLRTQSTESESMDITVKSNTERKCEKIEDLEMEFVSDCDFIVTKQDGNDIKDKEAIFKHDRTIHHIQINEDKNQHSNINKTGETPRAFLELKCGICGLEAKNRADFREHLFKVHNNKRVKCDQCERPFRDSYALRRHKIVKHSTDKNVKCDVCNKVFKLHDNMILHRQRFHERRFACEICGANQPTAYTLKKHVEMVHEKKNLFVCDICGEGFIYAHRFRVRYLVVQTKQQR